MTADTSELRDLNAPSRREYSCIKGRYVGWGSAPDSSGVGRTGWFLVKIARGAEICLA